MSVDTHDDLNPLNPANIEEIEVFENDEIENLECVIKSQKMIINYKIWQLSKLAEIEGTFKTFGFLTFEEQTQKNEILNQYIK